jgi:hypothetical protein
VTSTHDPASYPGLSGKRITQYLLTSSSKIIDCYAERGMFILAFVNEGLDVTLSYSYPCRKKESAPTNLIGN